MGMPSAQVQAGTQPQVGQFLQNSPFTTGMGSGPPNQPVPLNSMNLPVVGPSQEERDAAFARQNAELQARIARRAAAAANPGEPTFQVTGWDTPGTSTPFVTGGGSPEVRTMAGPQNQVTPQVGPSPAPQAGPSPTPQNQTSPMTQSKGKSGSTTNSATSGQPAFGQPNRYPNTVGQWDNASIQRTNRQPMAGGKGKG
jgi:hypothetical protein